MKILLIGATGLTGSLCLQKLLSDPVVSFVEIWVRKQLDFVHPKLKQRVIDFNQMPEPAMKEFQAFICCLGSTIKKSGTQERFRQIDLDYVVYFAQIAEKSKVDKFIVISSVGANLKSKNFYLRTKGEMEHAVLACNIPIIAILRPSLLLGKRNEYRFGERISQFMMKIMNFMFIGKLKRYKAIDAEKVAQTVVNLTKIKNQGKFIIESEEILKY